MDHNRAFLAAVSIGVLQLEALRQVVVYLDGSELPLASDGVLYHKVQLGAVECGLAFLHDGLEALLFRGVYDSLLGLGPVLVRTYVLLLVVRVAEGYLSHIVRHLERAEHVQDEVDNLLKLFLKLVGTAEEVGVVLGETSHAGEAVKLSALLVAVDGTELCEAQREVAVRARRTAEDLAVVRAVHRLEHILLPFLRGAYGLERILSVFGVMP